jgi:hypothetical protein
MYHREMRTLLLIVMMSCALSAGCANVAVVEPGRELSVGPGGQFATLNDALAAASTMRPRHVGNAEANGVVVRIERGFVVREQVALNAADMSHVRITGEGRVPVDTTGFVRSEDDRGSAPLFDIQRGSEAPVIDVIFEQVAGGNAVGLLLNRGSRGVITPNGGFVGFRDGATVNNGSTLSGRYATLQGSRWAVHARHMSDANLRSAVLHGGEVGAWARRASRIDARSADLSGNGGEGLRADNVSLIEAHGAVLRDRAVAAHAFRGGQINLLEAYFEGSQLAMRVTDGGFIYAHGFCNIERVENVYSVTPNELTAYGVIFTDPALAEDPTQAECVWSEFEEQP